DVTEHTFLYTCDDFTGEMKAECDEGELRWVDIDKVLELNLWEGDKVFLELLNTNKDFFTVKLIYDCDDNIIDYITE
ncbi:MAG: 8-oxo-dGTP diphosphatase, partial [Pseudobutyrivibrio sp.]|nr:8-oxo-dGTP diphosphatase [Pseudobutyrivibrio sp.]